MALQPGVGLGLLYITPPALSILCSVSPFLRSMDTSSNQLIFGLLLRLDAYSFPHNILILNIPIIFQSAMYRLCSRSFRTS